MKQRRNKKIKQKQNRFMVWWRPQAQALDAEFHAELDQRFLRSARVLHDDPTMPMSELGFRTISTFNKRGIEMGIVIQLDPQDAPPRLRATATIELARLPDGKTVTGRVVSITGPGSSDINVILAKSPLLRSFTKGQP